MSPATLEKPAEQMVTAKPGTVTFMARREDLKLVHKAERYRRNAEGDVVETIPGHRIKFLDGVLAVPPTGKFRCEKGEVIDAAELLEWLEVHPLNGDREEGFWRLEEPAPPVTPEEIEALTNLAIEQDADGIRELIAQEEAGWARDSLLGNARTLLERVEAKAEPEPKGPKTPPKVDAA